MILEAQRLGLTFSQSLFGQTEAQLLGLLEGSQNGTYEWGKQTYGTEPPLLDKKMFDLRKLRIFGKKDPTLANFYN